MDEVGEEVSIVFTGASGETLVFLDANLRGREEARDLAAPGRRRARRPRPAAGK